MGIDVEEQELLDALGSIAVKAKRFTKRVEGKMEKTKSVLVDFKNELPEFVCWLWEKESVTIQATGNEVL